MVCPVAFVLLSRLSALAPPDEGPAWLRPRSETPDGDRGDEPAEDVGAGEADEDARVIVVSTGTRTDRDADTSPVATEVISREEIVNSGAENLADALQEADASIQTSSSFNGTSLQLRGLDPEQVLILIDGQRVTGRVDGAIDLRRINVENVERIEVVKGAGSVLYGSDALGGVVNIVTRAPEPGVQAEAHGSYASRATLDLSGRVAGGGRRWGLAAFAGLHQTAGWDADPSDETTTGDALRQWNLGAEARLETRSRLRVSLAGDYLQRDSRGTSQTAGGAVLDRRNLTETSNATARFEWLAPDSRLSLTVHHNYFRDQFRQDQRGDDALDQYQPTDDHVIQLGAQFDQLVGHHVVTTGADAQLEFLETARVVTEAGEHEVERQRFALFVQDEWTPSLAPRVTLLPALRVDIDSQFGAYPTGRFALLVQAPESLTLRVSYARGYRAPSFREMYLAFTNAGSGYRVGGNAALRPEQAWTFDLGATWIPREFLRLSAGVFDNQLRDLITTDLITDADVDGLQVFGYLNIGSAHTRGLESSASIELLRYFTLTGSYTLLDARNQRTGQRLPGRATHQGSMSLEFHQRRWGTRLFARLGAWAARPYTGTAGQELSDPYASIDLRLSQSLFRYLTVFVGVENLLDAGDATLNPMAPRSFYGGATFRY